MARRGNLSGTCMAAWPADENFFGNSDAAEHEEFAEENFFGNSDAAEHEEFAEENFFGNSDAAENDI